MANIVFTASVFRGHLVATKTLVEELKTLGHNVHYYAPAKYQDMLAAMNVSYNLYPSFNSLESLISGKLSATDLHGRLFSLVNGTVNAAFDIIPWLGEEFNNKKVDLVIYDNMAFWGGIVANEQSIPSICSTSVMAINSNTIAATKEGSVYVDNMPDYVTQPLLNLKAMYKSDVSSLLDLITGQYSDHVILYTSKALQRHAEHFPETKYLFFPKRYDAQSFPLQNEISDSGGLRVFVSFGTLFNNDVDIFKHIIDAFGALNHNVTISAGAKQEIFNDLDNYNHYPHISVKFFVNQTEVLMESDIFLTHAGFNGVQEAIYHLVPMITSPVAGDQNFISKTLVDKGVAQLLDRNSSLEPQLRTIISDIQNRWDEYQINLKAIRDSLTAQETVDVVLAKIEQVIAGTSELHLDEL